MTFWGKLCTTCASGVGRSFRYGKLIGNKNGVAVFKRTGANGEQILTSFRNGTKLKTITKSSLSPEAHELRGIINTPSTLLNVQNHNTGQVLTVLRDTKAGKTLVTDCGTGVTTAFEKGVPTYNYKVLSSTQGCGVMRALPETEYLINGKNVYQQFSFYGPNYKSGSFASTPFSHLTDKVKNSGKPISEFLDSYKSTNLNFQNNEEISILRAIYNA